jgi:hypothetical protein
VKNQIGFSERPDALPADDGSISLVGSVELTAHILAGDWNLDLPKPGTPNWDRKASPRAMTRGVTSVSRDWV